MKKILSSVVKTSKQTTNELTKIVNKTTKTLDNTFDDITNDLTTLSENMASMITDYIEVLENANTEITDKAFNENIKIKATIQINYPGGKLNLKFEEDIGSLNLIAHNISNEFIQGITSQEFLDFIIYIANDDIVNILTNADPTGYLALSIAIINFSYAIDKYIDNKKSDTKNIYKTALIKRTVELVLAFISCAASAYEGGTKDGFLTILTKVVIPFVGTADGIKDAVDIYYKSKKTESDKAKLAAGIVAVIIGSYA